ncbi:MAG: methyl-accepting chemotaxis protein [Ruminococcus sp.]|jgi:methyl-accepting chemotaxis protein|nr:methyl-accepting chemotaxis protein [Ruminococcus sp.]
MKNLKIAPRLIISFLLVALLALILGIIGIISSTTLSNQVTRVYDENVLAINAVSVIRGRYNDIRLNAQSLARHGDDTAAVQQYKNTISSYNDEIEEATAVYEKTITDMSLETSYKDFTARYPAYIKTIDEIVSAAGTGGSAAAYEAFDKHDAEADEILAAIEGMADFNITLAEDTKTSADNIANVILIVQIAFIVAAIIISLALALIITKSVTVPVNYVTTILRDMGTKGRTNFTDAEWAEIHRFASGKDETAECAENLGNVATALNGVAQLLTTVAGGDLTISHKPMSEEDKISASIMKMIDNLNAMFGRISEASNQVSLGANQITDASQSLAQGSTEQAASVEELSAAIEDVAGKTKLNAKRATEASDMSSAVKENAEKGADQMTQMTAAVTEINQASQDISKVIKVIDDIAFQTNILALNAAVEAARAGEAGKGFAVVADEVRNLASKSAAAAKETGVLIENSMKKAELGSVIAGQTAASLADIVEGINKSTELISEIATGSEEQAHAIGQINEGILQVSQVVQKTSATAEECAASAEELNSLSVVLNGNVSQFKLKG